MLLIFHDETKGLCGRIVSCVKAGSKYMPDIGIMLNNGMANKIREW